MELSVRDVAILLKVSEKVVQRWVRNDSLPAHRVHDQYRFNRVDVQEWAALQDHSVPPDLFVASGYVGKRDELCAALERGGIFYDVPGTRREQVLEAISQLPGIPAPVNRQLLHQLLVARNAPAFIHVGEGIAIPHPRDPIVVGVNQPLALLCFLKQPLDLQIGDELLRSLFLLMSPSVRSHLQMLARLAFSLHDKPLMDLLVTTAPPDTILSRLSTIEKTDISPVEGDYRGDVLVLDRASQ